MDLTALLGVLSDTQLLLVGRQDGKRAVQSLPLSTEGPDFPALVQQAVRAGLTRVWVLPGTRVSHELSCAFLEQASRVWEVEVSVSPLDPTHPVCASIYRKLPIGRQGPVLSLLFPEYGRWGWQLPDALTLLATITYLEQILDVVVPCSPEQLALDLLNRFSLGATDPKNHSSSMPSTSEGHQLPILESAHEVVWMRPLTITEERQKYLHAYTNDTLKLEACRRVQLGAGQLRYWRDGRAYDRSIAGIWRVKAETAGSVFDGKRLPSCIQGEWMSTPEVACCQDLAYHVQVLEGYSWTASSPALEPWATFLGKTQQQVQMASPVFRHAQARVNTAHTLRMLPAMSLAKLAQSETTGGVEWPQWSALILGQSRAMLFEHLVRLVSRGFMPVLVDRDTLWFVSNDPNPLTAVPDLVMAKRPGAYRVTSQASLALSREVKAAFTTATSAQHLAQMLQALAGKQDETAPCVPHR